VTFGRNAIPQAQRESTLAFFARARPRDQVIRRLAVPRRGTPWFRGNMTLPAPNCPDERQMNAKCPELNAEFLNQP
jgi:hypothetical protein